MGNVTTSESSNNLIIYHQNIRSLMSEKDELNITMQDKTLSPYLICLSEHHLKTQEITKFTLDNYKIATSSCRERAPKGVHMYYDKT